MNENKKRRGSLIAFILVFTILFAAVAYVFIYKDTHENHDDPNENGSNEDSETSTPVTSKTLAYEISALNIDTDTNTARAVTQSKESCKLILRFINEESYFSKDSSEFIYIEGCYAEKHIELSADAVAGLNVASTEIEFPIIGELPQYFVAEAILTDENGNAVSSPYYNIRSSRKFAEFQALSADNYTGSGHIIKFDSTDSKQFGVLADDVKVITAKSVSGLLSKPDSPDVYDIVSPSEKMSKGDKVYVTDGVNFALFEVFWADEEGDTVSVCPNNPRVTDTYTLKDFYKVLKVDMTFTDDASEDASPAMISEKENIEKTISVGTHHFDFDPMNNVNVSGYIHDGKVSVDGYFIWAPALFGIEYFECEIDTRTSFHLTATVKAKVASAEDEEDKWFDIFDLPIPTPIAGLTVNVGFKGYFSWETEGNAHINSVPITAKSGFRYTTEEGLSSKGSNAKINLSEKDSDWFTFDAEINGNLGPTVTLGVEFLRGLIFTEISANATVVLNCKIDDDKIPSALNHKCFLCVDGTVSFSFHVDANAGFKLTEDIKWEPLDLEIYNYYNFGIYKFFVSFPDANAMPIFGTGYCQNYTLDYFVEQSCAYIDRFICNKHEKITDNRHYEQTEGSGNSSTESELWHFGYGEHGHITEKIRIEVTDLDTGTVLYTKLIDSSFNGYGIPDPTRAAESIEIPLSVKRIGLRAVCVCRVYECEVREVDSSDGYIYDQEFPYYTENHVIEYNILQDFVVERTQDNYSVMLVGYAIGPDGKEQSYPVSCLYLGENSPYYPN